MSAAELSREVFKVISRYDYSGQFGDVRNLIEEIGNLLLTGEYILGPEVTRFESSFARYCNCFHAKGVNTGTDAILIALRALGITEGDEVIAPANTFHATIAAIELAGATPVLVDPDEETYLLDHVLLPGSVSEKTRAIIPVHLFGKPVQMEDLLDFALCRGLLIIEDAAQAHGASIKGRRVGSFGAAGCFSFHPSKNLAAAGDAGIIVTNSAELAGKIDLYRALGQRIQNEHVVVGLNSKLDSVQALILSAKLPYLDASNRSRAQIAARYRSELKDLPLSFQAENPDEVHVYHLFQVRTSHRDQLMDFLRARGIDAVVRYPTPIHLQPAFQKRQWKPGQFPVAEALSRELLCLPLRPHMAEEDVLFVIEAVRDFYSKGYGVRQQ